MFYLLFGLFVVLVLAFTWTFFTRWRNRHTIALHRDPSNERKKRTDLIPEIDTMVLMRANKKLVNSETVEG